MSVIEKVARALCNRDYPNLDWSYVVEDFRNEYRQTARAAIEAMREPTEGMNAAVDALAQATISAEHDGGHERDTYRFFVIKAHRAMIQAALEGEG